MTVKIQSLEEGDVFLTPWKRELYTVSAKTSESVFAELLCQKINSRWKSGKLKVEKFNIHTEVIPFQLR